MKTDNKRLPDPSNYSDEEESLSDWQREQLADLEPELEEAKDNVEYWKQETENIKKRIASVMI